MARAMMSKSFIQGKFNLEASKQIDEENPTLIGISGGFKFHEHPRKGDEHELLYKYGKHWYVTTFFDLPTLSELGWDR